MSTLEMGQSPSERHFDDIDMMAITIADRWATWDNARSEWKKRRDELRTYVFATDTNGTTNASNEHSHTTTIPKLTHLYDTLSQYYYHALFVNKEFFEFSPSNQDEASVERGRVVKSYLKTKHELSKFTLELKKCLDDYVREGNCFAEVMYVTKMKKDKITGQDAPVFQGPVIRRISPIDIVFDPTAESFGSSPKITRRLLDRGAFAKMVMEQTSAKFDEYAVKAVLEFGGYWSGQAGFDIDRRLNLLVDGFGSASEYIKSGMVELLEFRGDIYDAQAGILYTDRVITVADRRIVVRNESSEDLTGGGVIVKAGYREREGNLWAMGPLDNVVGMQYLINHLENARADAFDQILFPDRLLLGNIQKTERDDGGYDYVSPLADGDVRNLAPDVTVLSADNKIAQLMQLMDMFAGVPPEMAGFRTPGEKTKFEVDSLTSAPARLFAGRLAKFDAEFIEPILNKQLELAITNLDSEDAAKVINDDNGLMSFITITKTDLAVTGTLRAVGSRAYAQKSEAVQELAQFSSVLASDPALAVHFPAKARAKAWNMLLSSGDMGIYKEFGGLAEMAEAQLKQKTLADAAAAQLGNEVPPTVG